MEGPQAEGPGLAQWGPMHGSASHHDYWSLASYSTRFTPKLKLNKSL